MSECGRRPRTSMGKAAVAGDERVTVGIGRPTSDQNPAGHLGNDDGMSVHGDPTQHGKPQAAGGRRDPQPDARRFGQGTSPGRPRGFPETVDRRKLRSREGASVQGPEREGEDSLQIGASLLLTPLTGWETPDSLPAPP